MQTLTQAARRRRLKLAIVVLSAGVALVAAIISVSSVSLLPPKLEPRQLQVSTATARIMVDGQPPTALNPRAKIQDVDALTKRAEVLGRIVASPRLVSRIGARAGIRPDRIAALARTTGSVPNALKEPTSEQRANQILLSRRPYKLEVQASPTSPILVIYAQAPAPAEAKRLADSTVAALRAYLLDLAARQAVPVRQRVRLLQLGQARGMVVNGRARPLIATLTFLVVFALSIALSMLGLRIWRGPAAFGRATQPRPVDDATIRPDDPWPRTTRILPWMLAFFMAILWLVPFNSIELSVSLPIDLKLDRLVLPFIAGLWLLALAAGGRAAPRLRLTPIHAAVGTFVLIAFLSVVLNAHELNRALELSEAEKRLPLLVAYVSLFVIASTVVRPREVRPFMIYTLLLAVACAVGMIWEYRFKYNVFYDFSQKTLPGAFEFAGIEADAGGVDELGRRLVRGPAAIPLEAVAMLAMAMPIAVVEVMRARRWRGRLLYGLAGCLLFAAILATYRKSGLLAPAAGLLTLGYFRRRELLRLAPLAPILVLAIHVLSPGALGSTTSQLDPSRLGVNTVSDRAIDYDAIRPEIWTHMGFGRGWGTYDHTVYRILDSEILQMSIAMGILGLLAFLAISVSVLATARVTIGSRDPTWAPPALAGAAAVVSFAVVSTLFDVLSFPHATYIYLYMAGLVGVVVGAHRQEPIEAAQRRGSPESGSGRRGHLWPKAGTSLPRVGSSDPPARHGGAPVALPEPSTLARLR